MSHWSGLGYYTRARNLHRCAQRIVAEYDGVFPAAPDLLADLPGIGRSTAAAITAFSYGTLAAILDGNVKRVFARVFGVDGYPGEKKIENAMWERAVALLPEQDVEAYTQGLMDLGATLCTRSSPSCGSCPLASRCVALATGRVKDLPVRKPKKTIPEKQIAMLVIVDHGEVLLEQRPDSGIWGGLLSLPEAQLSADDLHGDIGRCVLTFGNVDQVDRLLPFSHGFTHFKLHVAPYKITLSKRLDLVGQRRHVWYRTDKLAHAPLPAPIKKMLLALFAQDDLLSDARLV